MFFYGNFTLVGFPTVKGAGMWTAQDEQFVCEVFGSRCMEYIRETGAPVVIPREVPMMVNPEGINGWRDALAGVLPTVDQGPLFAISPQGLQRWVKYVDSQGLSPQQRQQELMGLIVHEMTHLQQVREGRLIEVTPTEIVWEGQTWDKSRIESTHYMELPWEAEAFHAQAEVMSGSLGMSAGAVLNLIRQQFDLFKSGKLGI